MEGGRQNNLDEAIKIVRQKNNEFDYSIDLDDKKINKYKGYASINFDLMNVGESILQLLALKEKKVEEQSQELKINQLTERSLFVSSIVTYARCFTKTKGRGIRLENRDCFNTNQFDFKRLHDNLIEIRNQYLAHAGVSNSERVFASANFNIIDDNEIEMRLSYEIFGQYGLDKNDMLMFIELIKYLISHTVKKRDEAAKDYTNSLTVEEKNELLRKAQKKNKR